MKKLTMTLNVIWLILLACSFATLVGCTEEGDTINNPVAPTAPSDPPPNNSAVFPQASGICAPTGPCNGDFSVTLASGQTVDWVFTGGQPPTSSAAAGGVRWPAPSSYNWSSNVCEGSACNPAQNTITFISTTVAASMAVDAGLISGSERTRMLSAMELSEVDPWTGLESSGLMSVDDLERFAALLLE